MTIQLLQTFNGIPAGNIVSLDKPTEIALTNNGTATFNLTGGTLYVPNPPFEENALGVYVTPARQLVDQTGAVIPVGVAPQPPTTFIGGQSGTFTTPTDANGNRAKSLIVRGVAGGGGGAGSGSTAGIGSDGTDTSFGTLVATHGSKGIVPVNASATGGGVGGAAIGGDLNITGNAGSGTAYNTQTYYPGGTGGATPFGQNVPSIASGNTGSPPANSGCGGNGGSVDATAPLGGAGGGGGYFEKVISAPAANYSYSVGTGGAGGTAGGGTSPKAGSAGAGGFLEITPFF